MIDTHLPIVLAIDTSCDDTSVAVTQGVTVLSNVIASQTELHRQYGGVFPTVAKQAHLERLPTVTQVALQRAQKTWLDIQLLAVTQGPGLAPALEVGITYAQQLAAEHNLPLVPVNHLEGHLLSVLAKPRQAADNPAFPNVTFPVLGLLVSGGHTEIILVKNWGEYEVVGHTLDDAAGEALDKFGRMVGLGYPAGPVVEQFAKLGDSRAFEFPLPMTTSGNFHLSYSGLKTSVRQKIEKLTAEQPLTKQQIYDLCANFQHIGGGR